METEYILKTENIKKSFPGAKALDNVTFNLKKGEIHALVGENGAGKSTLIKILSGAHSKDSGKIFFDGNEIEIKSPNHAQLLGISMVYQESNVIEDLDVASNIFLGKEGTRNLLSFLNTNKLESKAKDILKDLNCNISPKTNVRDLSVANKQMIEIAKALSRNAKVIILDEPTSSLTPKEIETLFRMLYQLRNNGVSIIFVTHKLDEVFKISDRITVLRDGQKTGTLITKETTTESLIKLMVGRELKSLYESEESESRNYNRSPQIVLEINNISRGKILRNINLKLYKKEILGVFGLIGSGRTELAKTIFGVDKMDYGEIKIDGKNVKIRSPKNAIEAGIGLIPEDRKLEGIIPELTVRENITIAKLKELLTIIFVKIRTEIALADYYIKRLNIKTPNREQKVINLSGGNQQKVLISRWLALKPKVLIMDEPTRGIDVGAKAEIYKLMKNVIKEEGISIIMISSELPEILGMSDRIIVMNQGAIAGEIDKSSANEEKIMALAVKMEVEAK